MENEERISPVTDVSAPDHQKPKSKKGLVTVIIFLVFAGWFINDRDPSELKATPHLEILEKSSVNFYEKFKPNKIEAKIDLVFDENFTDDEKISMYRNIDLALSYLNPVLKNKRIGLRVFFSRNELSKDLLAGEKGSDRYEGLLEDLGPDGVFGNDPNCFSPSTVGITYSNLWDDTYIYILAKCAWEKNSDDEWDLLDPDVFAHELVHAAQESWFGPKSEFFYCFMPNWFVEGQAQFVSSRISTVDGQLNPYLFRKLWLGWEPNGKLEDDESYESKLGPYSDGAFAIEYLVGKYGWKKLEKLVENLDIRERGDCGDSYVHERFNFAFRQTYKQSLKTFYREVRPYIKWNKKELG
ncbi:MAG: Peptidase superfamily [Actinomycetota bacterium]|jgi:hypothetical protein